MEFNMYCQFLPQIILEVIFKHMNNTSSAVMETKRLPYIFLRDNDAKHGRCSRRVTGVNPLLKYNIQSFLLMRLSQIM
jgi:hypothetical protein